MALQMAPFHCPYMVEQLRGALIMGPYFSFLLSFSDKVSWCSPGWPPPHSSHAVLASQVLGL